VNIAALQRRALRNRVAHAAVSAALPIADRADLVRLGSDYGGWWVPDNLVRRGGVAYCAGVGTDITFDVELVRRYGFQVWAFDPTPSVIESVGTWTTPVGWHFEPVGIWDCDDRIRFYVPESPRLGSLSATSAHGGDAFVEAQVESIDSVMCRLGHHRIDLLKMDIEGAEGPVLCAMIEAGIRPAVLCVEFDQPEAPWRVGRRVRSLLDDGYVLHKTERWNFTFAHRDAVNAMNGAL
jgi:FkbM family methyltransferase